MENEKELEIRCNMAASIYATCHKMSLDECVDMAKALYLRTKSQIEREKQEPVNF